MILDIKLCWIFIEIDDNEADGCLDKIYTKTVIVNCETVVGSNKILIFGSCLG